MFNTIQFSVRKTVIWIKFEEPANTLTVGKCWDLHYHLWSHRFFYISIYFISKCLKITKLLYNTVLQRKYKRKIQDDTNTFGLFPINDNNYFKQIFLTLTYLINYQLAFIYLKMVVSIMTTISNKFSWLWRYKNRLSVTLK